MTPHICGHWCKVHWYWDFQSQTCQPYPQEKYFITGPPINGRRQWAVVTIYCGPPAYYPKKPTQTQMTNIAAYCPHTQGDLTCNNCLRHTFHPYEV